MVTIVGVGIQKGDLTERGKRAIESGGRVFSRVKLWFPTEVIDGSGAENYAALDELIADAVTARDDSVYCALGDGFTDTAVAAIAARVPVAIVPGVGEYRGRIPSASLVSIAACDLRPETEIDTSMPLMVYGIDDALAAGELKPVLSDIYGEETEAVFSTGETCETIRLYELDRMKKYAGAALFVAGRGELVGKRRYGFSDLLAVMSRLTASDGCPWDKAQTHDSIRINMIEEAYEAVDAIDKRDEANLREELGDVLLQSIFHCNIAERTGEFTTRDVISELVGKLVTRHTHIFGENKAADPEAALGFWEKAKTAEKGTDETLRAKFSRLPDSFPSLLFAAKVCKKAAKAGADFDAAAIAKKLTETVAGGVTEENAGEVLFLASALCSMAGADCEVELNKRAREAAETLAEAEEEGRLKEAASKL